MLWNPIPKHNVGLLLKNGSSWA